MRSRRAVQASRNTVWPPARASTASGTNCPAAGGAPRHHRLDSRPLPEISASVWRASSANQAEATRERRCSVCIVSAWLVGSGLASCSGSARSTTPSRRCGLSVPLAQALSQGVRNTSSWPHNASAWVMPTTYRLVPATTGVAAVLTAALSHSVNTAEPLAPLASTTLAPLLRRISSSICTAASMGMKSTRPSASMARPAPSSSWSPARACRSKPCTTPLPPARVANCCSWRWYSCSACRSAARRNLPSK